MEGGNISDEQITASTTHSSMFVPRNARLNYQGDYGRKGGWVSSHNDYNQWLQVDFIKKVKLDKVATQGRHNYNQWVISYSLSYSMDGNNFQLYKQCGEVQVSFLNDRSYCRRTGGGGGGGRKATSHTFSQMKSKRCSHNLQSNHRGNSQRFRKMLLSRLSNLCSFPAKNKNGIGYCQTEANEKRHTEKLTSVDL